MAVDPLESVVAEHLEGTDPATLAIVTAIAGLLMAVAYADQKVTAEEERVLRTELGRVHGLSQQGVQVICEVLAEHRVAVSTALVPRYTRALREHADEELKTEILGVLVELAAADGEISLTEVTQLRNIAHAMGLSQGAYNALQAKHRDKLSFLR
jgi:uncharacterized tellurite resistance protein B-like protein